MHTQTNRCHEWRGAGEGERKGRRGPNQSAPTSDFSGAEAAFPSFSRTACLPAVKTADHLRRYGAREGSWSSGPSWLCPLASADGLGGEERGAGAVGRGEARGGATGGAGLGAALGETFCFMLRTAVLSRACQTIKAGAHVHTRCRKHATDRQDPP